MLSENIYVNRGGVTPKEVSHKCINIRCTKCNCEIEVSDMNIDDYTDSDPHDPLQDYFICPVCEYPIGLFNGIVGTTDGEESVLWADGTFIYITVGSEDFRIV